LIDSYPEQTAHAHCQEDIDSLRLEILQLKQTLVEREDECDALKDQLAIEKFGVERFSTDNKLIKFYTGFENYKVLYAFYNYIYMSANSIQSVYYIKASETPSLAGRPRNMQIIDEL